MANVAVLVIAIGMTLVILTGQVDVSVGALVRASAPSRSALLARDGVPVPLAASRAVLLGAAIGLANGVLVGGLGLPSIVVTLAMLVVLRDGLRWATEGAWVRDLPAASSGSVLDRHAGEALIIGATLVVIALAGVGAAAPRGGARVYASGSDAGVRAARRPAPVAHDDAAAFVVLWAPDGRWRRVLNAVRFGEVPGTPAQASS